MKSTILAMLMIGMTVGTSNAAPARDKAAFDYRTAGFASRKVVEWGTRPVWSADGRRIAFTEDDALDTFGFELDLETQTVRCVTCHLGMEGRIRRIYYLPDGNYILLGKRGLGRSVPPSGVSSKSTGFTQELYFLANTPNAKLQPLNANAFGDMAIKRIEGTHGTRIAWGDVSEGRSMLHVGVLRVENGKALLEQRTTPYDSAKQPKPSNLTFSEAYDFTADGKGVTFYTIAAEKGTFNGEMYVADIASGRLSKLYDEPAHNETHLFPDNRFGLEESNRATDPDGKWKGISSHPPFFGYLFKGYPGFTLPPASEFEAYESSGKRGFGRLFDLYLVSIDGSAPPRRLTEFSEYGANTHQSAVSPDGRRIVYAIDPHGNSKMAGKEGIYVGEFSAP